MKAYFINLFNYDRFATQIILKTITDAGNPERPVQIMAHMLAAQQTWLTRCKGVPLKAYTLWPEPNIAAFENHIANNSKEWVTFIEFVEQPDFEKNIKYANTKGDVFENKLTDMMMQVINHGTHHRAQIGQLLKFAGTDPLPNTDYISYVRYVQQSK